MANQEFKRTPGKSKFAYMGIDLHNPPDLIPVGRAPYLLNVSPDQTQGAMNQRAGLTKLGAVPTAGHSVKRVNNILPGANPSWQRFVGAGTSLYVGQTGNFTLLDTGFSGNPLSMVPYRPPQSPETWLYVYDSQKQAKYRTDGVTKQAIGILPPRTAPITALAAPTVKQMADVTSTTNWTVSGVAAGTTLVNRVPADTHIDVIVYDTGTTGWACIKPLNTVANYAGLGVGARVNIGSELVITIQQISPELSAGTVVGQVLESGTTYIVTPTGSVQGLLRNHLVSIGGVYTRVLSVTQGPDGLYSFRVRLASAPTVGAAITIPTSFRVFTNSNHVAAEVISTNAMQTVLTPVGLTGVGTLAFTVAGGVDLSQVNNRPLTADDYVHVSFYLDAPANVQEVHIMFDVDSTVNDFNHNYFLYVVRQGDFEQVSQGALSVNTSNLNALANQIANVNSSGSGIGQVPYPAASMPNYADNTFSDQFAVGNGQWFECVIKVNDLTRVGTDPSVSMSKVFKFGVMAVVTGAVTLAVGSAWVGGSYGPDINQNSYGNQGQPIIYRYRYRSSLTGAFSELSPATRNGELPWRQGVNVTLTASTDTQVDLIDIERNGGTFTAWHRFLTVPNASATVLDSVKETVAMAGEPLELLSYAPWPVTDKPRYGTCNIVGTRVTWISGDTFNLNWIRGVEFIVNNQTYTLYAPPDSTTTLSTTENIGTLTGVSFIIPEATIIGFPLPYACGPFEGRQFATGDPYNPGNLYFSNSYNPDSASDQGYIEVTSPSEPLGPPVIYEGTIYVQSANAVYRVDSTPGQANPYAAYKLGSAVGLSAFWAVTARGPILAWLGADGIYALSGSGAGESLTQDIYPIFPFESRPGLPVSVNGFTIYPPDYNAVSSLRLGYANGFLLFDYLDTQAAQKTLALNLITKGWIPYQYTPGIVMHYEEEGVPNPLTLALGANGSIYNLSGSATDDGAAFTCVVIPPSDDQGETRARKQYGDLMLDYAGTPAAHIYYDNYLLSSITPTIATAATRTQTFIDLGLDTASLHRNIGGVFSWLSSSGTVLYEWQPSYLAEPEDTIDRPTDWMDAGTIGYKFVHGLRITADTGGITRTVQIQYDGGILGPVLSCNHAGEVTLPYSFVPFKAHLMRLVPTDAHSWRLMAVEWVVNPEPEITSFWITQPTSFDLPGYLHIRDCQLAYALVTPGAVITLVVDGISYTLSAYLQGTAGREVKQYLVAPPAKGKIWQIYGTGPTLQLYLMDCEFRVKSWGGVSYVSLKPYGDLTGGDARI